MISLTIILLILVIHFLADFVLQSDWMAHNKAKDWKVLSAHVVVYTVCLSPFGFAFSLINGLLHFVTDAISSRATAYLWQKQERHWFFVVIGLDQLVHYTCLFGTWVWLN